MDKEKQGFVDIVDELNWAAVELSEGHVDAVSSFVQNRNQIRAKQEQEKNSNLNKGGRTL